MPESGFDHPRRDSTDLVLADANGRSALVGTSELDRGLVHAVEFYLRWHHVGATPRRPSAPTPSGSACSFASCRRAIARSSWTRHAFVDDPEVVLRTQTRHFEELDYVAPKEERRRIVADLLKDEGIE